MTLPQAQIPSDEELQRVASILEEHRDVNSVEIKPIVHVTIHLNDDPNRDEVYDIEARIIKAFPCLHIFGDGW